VMSPGGGVEWNFGRNVDYIKLNHH